MWKRNDSTINAVIAGDLNMDQENFDNRDQEEIEGTTSTSGEDIDLENDDSSNEDSDSKYQGKPLEDQVRDLNATLKKVNQENKSHKKQIKDLQKENEELKQTAVNLKDQISNSKTEKEFAKKIQDLQEKLQEREERHKAEVDSLKKEFALSNYSNQIKDELMKAGAKPEVMEYLLYEANKYFEIKEDEEGNYIPVIENEQKSSRKLDPKTKDWVDNDFSDLASMMRDKSKYAEFFKAKTVVGIPSGSKVQRGSNNKAEKKIELARKIQKARTDVDRISLRAQAQAEGFDYRELESLPV